MSSRTIRAVAVGAAAAGAYLAGGKVREGMPVKPSALVTLALVGLATVMNSRYSAKAAAVDARVSNMLTNGFSVGGRIDILSGNLHMHGNNINLEGGTVVP